MKINGIEPTRPYAMMVHFDHTAWNESMNGFTLDFLFGIDPPFARFTVMCPGRFERFTSPAPTVTRSLISHSLVAVTRSRLVRIPLVPIFGNLAGIGQTRSPVADQQTNNQRVEPVNICFRKRAGFDEVEQPLRGERKESDECRHSRWRQPLQSWHVHRCASGTRYMQSIEIEGKVNVRYVRITRLIRRTLK